MYTVYIICNEITKRYYIGYTSDIKERLLHHNSGATKSTRGKGDWKIIYQEPFDNKRDAWARERQIKKYKGGNAFKKLISGGFA